MACKLLFHRPDMVIRIIQTKGLHSPKARLKFWRKSEMQTESNTSQLLLLYMWHCHTYQMNDVYKHINMSKLSFSIQQQS